MQEEVTGTMGEVDNSARAPRVSHPGEGTSSDINQRWQLMDLDDDGGSPLGSYSWKSGEVSGTNKTFLTLRLLAPADFGMRQW